MGQFKSLFIIRKKTGGRDSRGHVSSRHRGGEEKRYLRQIDWWRQKDNILATVASIEYDPNRTSRLALLHYQDGSKSFILAPSKLKVGQKVVSGSKVAIKDGNCLELRNIPVGVPIHAITFQSKGPAKMVKSAGSSAFVQSVEGNSVVIKLPSGESRLFPADARATIGQIGNENHSNIKLTKAGQSRHLGIRPKVRGVAQNPHSHPHGGGEGRSSVGMNPKTRWGKPAMGKKTRKRKKYSNRLIIQHRKK